MPEFFTERTDINAGIIQRNCTRNSRRSDRAYDRSGRAAGAGRARGLDTVRAAGSHGSPTQRTERDSFATMYEDRLTQLRAVEDRLVFGRLDDVKGEHRYIGRIGPVRARTTSRY